MVVTVSNRMPLKDYNIMVNNNTVIMCVGCLCRYFRTLSSSCMTICESFTLHFCSLAAPGGGGGVVAGLTFCKISIGPLVSSKTEIL